MGYYTHYTLEIDGELTEDLEDYLSSEESSPSGYGPLIDYINGNADSCKWYDHEDDMRKISKLFPKVLFTLIGTGEQNDDMWIKYFKGGKMQVCPAKISYDEFDPQKLE